MGRSILAIALSLLLAIFLDSFLVSCQATPPTPKGTWVTVARVASGNTLEVNSRDNPLSLTQRVRLIGVDAPDPEQYPWGVNAIRFLESQIDNQTVLMETDLETEDRFDRALVYVWFKGQLINEELVAKGHALAAPRSPNLKYSRRIAHAQDQARVLGFGIWSPDKPLRQTPAEFRAANRS